MRNKEPQQSNVSKNNNKNKIQQGLGFVILLCYSYLSKIINSSLFNGRRVGLGSMVRLLQFDLGATGLNHRNTLYVRG